LTVSRQASRLPTERRAVLPFRAQAILKQAARI
jgi:cation transport regulator ChaB